MVNPSHTKAPISPTGVATTAAAAAAAVVADAHANKRIQTQATTNCGERIIIRSERPNGRRRQQRQETNVRHAVDIFGVPSLHVRPFF